MNDGVVWIIILHWKELEHTRRCLNSLRNLLYENYQILVVDNNSSDGSLEQLKLEFPEVTFIAIAANLGFAGGCNIGIKYTLSRGASYVLLLNNDTRPSPTLLRDLVLAVASIPNLGILTPKVVYEDEPTRLYGLGGSRLPFRVRLRDMEAIDRGPWNGPPILLDFVFGCAMLIKREVIERVGYFDEDFFMYFEDIDYCYRVTEEGFVVGYLPGLVLHHVGAGSTRRRGGIREFLLGRSRQLFFRKHVQGWWRLVYVVYELFYTVRYLVRLIRRGQFRGAILYLGGTLAGLVQAHNRLDNGFDSKSNTTPINCNLFPKIQGSEVVSS